VQSEEKGYWNKTQKKIDGLGAGSKALTRVKLGTSSILKGNLKVRCISKGQIEEKFQGGRMGEGGGELEAKRRTEYFRKGKVDLSQKKREGTRIGVIMNFRLFH